MTEAYIRGENFTPVPMEHLNGHNVEAAAVKTE